MGTTVWFPFFVTHVTQQVTKREYNIGALEHPYVTDAHLYVKQVHEEPSKLSVGKLYFGGVPGGGFMHSFFHCRLLFCDAFQLQ